MAAILVVEDCEDFVELIERALQAHDLTFARSLEEARRQLDDEALFDLILLDLTLPDGDGLSLGSELSSGGRPAVPIIFLSARTDVRDKVAAFSLGAEDYVEKPFDILELQARVNARLRRFADEAGQALEVRLGDLRIELDNMRAFGHDADGEIELDLSPTEHRILRTLVEKPGRLMTREQLMSRIWGDTIVGPRTVDSHVSNLRAKLRGTGTHIESVRGQGYRLGIQDAAVSDASAASAR